MINYQITFSSIKWLVCIGSFLLLWNSEESLPLYYVSIAILGTACGNGLKIIIKQPRPYATTRSDYGMPSTHALALIYFGIILHFRLISYYFAMQLFSQYILLTIQWIYIVTAW